MHHVWESREDHKALNASDRKEQPLPQKQLLIWVLTKNRPRPCLFICTVPVNMYINGYWKKQNSCHIYLQKLKIGMRMKSITTSATENQIGNLVEAFVHGNIFHAFQVVGKARNMYFENRRIASSMTDVRSTKPQEWVCQTLLEARPIIRLNRPSPTHTATYW